MVIRPTPIEVPKGIEPYVFGSALVDFDSANDIDILFVYDSGEILAASIYAILAPIRVALEQHVGRKVHPVVLSSFEMEFENFRKRVASVALREWLQTFDRARSESDDHEPNDHRS